MSEDLRYPIGQFSFDAATAPKQREAWIHDLARLPGELEGVLDTLDDDQLDTPYRPEGWTVRQVVHHLADSHMNAYIRIRLGLTEDAPLVKGYDEKLWAELVDARTAPVASSLSIVQGAHSRWVTLLNKLAPEDFQRTMVHPQSGPGSIEKYTALYAWHGAHHVAQIRNLRQRNGW
ncbi:MAG: putative metal-dependent hydrolase [Bryobacterales bacterium]|nr:putative metal-dependent hydrolase [Bryobacterales bacterium]